ncbi:MAG TPA: tyrosine-protein phosphatase [Clostridiales bacterium]|jgi:protein-tyrosine phosphatase|nr:tyrosine-protein phosphatase [Clostridiales bacterium]
MSAKRRIVFDYIENFRDLGGYPLENGGVTKFGRLYRCGIPRDPSEEDMKKVCELGIKNIIDLRGDGEASMMPSAFLKNSCGINYKQISLLEVNPAAGAPAVTLSDIYIHSVEEYKENYAKVFKLLSQAEAPTVFHCFLGKDRTGIVASMLLKLAGVLMEDITADYQISRTYLEPFYQRELENDTGLIWESEDDHLMSKPENIINLHMYLDATYGGTAGYLAATGLGKEEIDRIGKLLI